MKSLVYLAQITVVIILTIIIAGCAGKSIKPDTDTDTDTGLEVSEQKQKSADPWEKMNRKTYAFNKALDKAILSPITDVYIAVTPDSVQTGVSNFFNNLLEVHNFANHLLQGEIVDASHVVGRLMLNSTFGLVGVFDLASAAGMDKRPDNFGFTLAKWGAPSGPYLVLPFFGPNTIRSSAALPVDKRIRDAANIDLSPYTTELTVLQAINARRKLKKIQGFIFGDEYTFVRDAYLQRQQTAGGKGRSGFKQPQVDVGDDDFGDEEFESFD